MLGGSRFAQEEENKKIRTLPIYDVLKEQFIFWRKDIIENYPDDFA